MFTLDITFVNVFKVRNWLFFFWLLLLGVTSPPEHCEALLLALQTASPMGFRPGMTRSTREKESPELVLQTGRNVSNQTGKVTDKKMHRLQLYVRPTRLHPGRSQPCRSYAVDITINKISFSIDSDLTSRRLLSALASVCHWAARQKTPSCCFSSCGRACFLRAGDVPDLASREAGPVKNSRCG